MVGVQLCWYWPMNNKNPGAALPAKTWMFLHMRAAPGSKKSYFALIGWNWFLLLIIKKL